MGRWKRARHRRYEDAKEPFLFREYGGAPVWMLIGALVLVIGVGVFAAYHML